MNEVYLVWSDDNRTKLLGVFDNEEMASEFAEKVDGFWERKGIDVVPCEHLLAFRKVIEENGLEFELNDGFSDWVICPKCGLRMCIDADNMWHVQKE